MLSFPKLAVLASSLLPAIVSATAATEPGYFTNFTTIPDASNLTFGQHYAVLNLDMINGLVGSVNTTTAGQTFINKTATWINTVHQQSPPPLSIFTRIYFSNSHTPEISSLTPFALAAAGLGNATATSPQSQIYPAFSVLQDWDVVLQKTRYDATFSTQLIEILRAQGVDTVILSGIRTSGVILSTTYTLFDENFKVYVIADTCIETPPDAAGASSIDQAIKEGIIPKLPADVIRLDQAIAALGRSGPVKVYGY